MKMKNLKSSFFVIFLIVFSCTKNEKISFLIDKKSNDTISISYLKDTIVIYKKYSNRFKSKFQNTFIKKNGIFYKEKINVYFQPNSLKRDSFFVPFFTFKYVESKVPHFPLPIFEPSIEKYILFDTLKFICKKLNTNLYKTEMIYITLPNFRTENDQK